MKNKCAVLFSGGTDSLCAAALSCEKFSEVHLLTFFEAATKKSPVPDTNVHKLRLTYPNTTITHHVVSTDEIVKSLNYTNYLKNILKFHLINLSTPGLSSLSWHLATIVYCKRNNINYAFDGMTQELLHLPGHMYEIRQLFTEFYTEFNIQFSSPVINWEVPQDQRFIDKLVVDRHGFTIQPKTKPRSTGEWLFKNKLLPHPNVKGSAFDRLMQHDCYPFVVYNMLVFWIFEPLIGFEKFKSLLAIYMQEKINLAKTWLYSNSNINFNPATNLKYEAK